MVPSPPAASAFDADSIQRLSAMQSASTQAIISVSANPTPVFRAGPGPISRSETMRTRSEEHTLNPVTNAHLVCRLLLEKNKPERGTKEHTLTSGNKC